MSRIVSRTMFGIGTYADVVISPATTTSPVVSSVSHATRDLGSCSSRASRMASDTWSAILSGWPSVTDSEVKVQRVMGELLLSALCQPRRGGVEDGGRDLALAAQGHVDRRAVDSDDENFVGVVLEPGSGGGHVVGHDEIEVLAPKLVFGLAGYVERLGREPDQHLAGPLGRAEAGQDVGRRLEHDLGDAVVLLELVIGHRLGPEVGDGGGHHDD